MSTKIISDSTCDLTPEIIDRYSIGITPLYVTKDGRSFQDGVDITPQDIFAHVNAGGALCSTAAVSQHDYELRFAEALRDHDAVIQITIGAEFSSCYQNACAAARSFPNVYVIDSANLSSGQGHVVVAAAKMAEQNLPPEEIAEKLRKLTPRVEASFLIERLDYMRKGGRCSTVAALGANLLNLKPCIEVISGKMKVVRKYRGPFEKCIRQYVRERLEGRNDIEQDLLFITHPAAAAESVEAARSEAVRFGRFKEIVETRAGCTISCHCGPHTLGILFVKK